MPEAKRREETDVFTAFLVKNKLKRSDQREAILEAFLDTKDHVSIDELWRIVRERRRDVGRTTVYRTLKLLLKAGLASELQLEGETRYEPDYKRAHHDHFVCRQCGAIFEFASPDIERIQDEIANKLGFRIEGHRHQVYGSCRRCGESNP